MLANIYHRMEDMHLRVSNIEQMMVVNHDNEDFVTDEENNSDYAL